MTTKRDGDGGTDCELVQRASDALAKAMEETKELEKTLETLQQMLLAKGTREVGADAAEAVERVEREETPKNKLKS